MPVFADDVGGGAVDISMDVVLRRFGLAQAGVERLIAESTKSATTKRSKASPGMALLAVFLVSLMGWSHNAAASTTINESFTPSVINQGDSSLYTISITNDSTVALTNAMATVFLDNTVAAPNVSGGNVSITTGTVLSNTCAFGSVTAVAGSNKIVLSGGTIPAGSLATPSICSFSLNVTSTIVGTFHAVIPANTTPNANTSGYEATENTTQVNNGTSADITLQVNGLSAPTGNKTFSPSPAIAGDISTLTIALSNPNAGSTMPLTSFTDTLPTGSLGSAMVIAAAPAPSINCTGSGASNGTLTATAGSGVITLSGGVIGQSGTCTIVVPVIVASIGGTSETFNNSLAPGAIGNTRGLVSPAFSRSLTVNTPVSVSKSFNPTLIPAGQPSLMTLTINNSSLVNALPITSFSDNMPAEITLLDATTAGASNPSVACTGTGASNGTLTAVLGSSTVSLAGAQAGPSGHCTISVYVTSTVDGAHLNTIAANAVTNPANFPSASVSATLTANAQLTIGKSVTVSSVAPGQWTQFSVTINNWSGGAVTGVNFKDVLPVSGIYQMVLNGVNPTSSVGCTGGSWTGTTAGGVTTGVAPADGDAGIMWNGGTVAAGSGATPGTCTIVFQARLPATATTGLTFTNQIPAASVTGTGPSGGVTNPAASPAINVTSIASGAVVKAFAPNQIAQGGLSTLTITIYNRTVTPLTAVNLTDNLPVGVTLAANPAATNSCGGVLQAFPSSSSVILTGGTVAARPDASQQASCAITVKVTGTALGSHTNTINTGDFSTAEGVTIPAAVTANLQINTGLGGSKSFLPTSVSSGGKSRATITITNTSSGQLTGVSLNDNGFGAGLTIANPANAATSCTGSPTIVANPGANTAQLFGATLSAGGSCQLSFDVVTSGAGPWTNSVPIGNVTSDQGVSNAAAVSATLNATAAQININKSFNPVIVTGGVPSTLTLTLTNPSAVSLHGIGFSDVFPSGIQVYSVPSITSTCSGGTVTAIPGDNKVSLSGASMGASSSCSITLQTTSVKFLNLTNTIPAGAISSTEGYTNPSLVSATLSTLQGLGVMKAFEPAYVAPNTVTKLKMWLVSTFDPNAPSPVTLTGVSYTDTLPAGLVVAGTPNATTTCLGPGGAGAATIVATPGSNLVTVSGSQINPGTNCLIEVNVQSPGTLGTYINLIPALSITTDQGATNNSPASAPLYVVNQPTIAKAFSPSQVNVGTYSTLTVTISNGATIDLTGVALNDVLPSGLVIAGTPTASTTCVYGAVNANPGTGVLSISGATIPHGGSCTFQARVVANAAGSYLNNIASGQITSNQGVTNPGPATDTLTVRDAPTVGKTFNPVSIDGTGIAPNGISTLTITLGNPGASAITLNTTFVDALPGNVVVDAVPNVGGTCTLGSVTAVAGGTSVSYANGATIPPGGCTITVKVTSTTPGVYTNTIAAGQLSTTAGGNQNPAIADLAVGPGALVPPTVGKAFSPGTIALGGVSTLAIALGNSNTSALTLSTVLTDNLPVNVVVAALPNIGGSCTTGSVTATAGGGSVSYANGASIPAGGCTITVDVTSATGGIYTNMIAAGAVQTNGGNNAQPATASLVVQTPIPPTVQKSFNPGTINPGGVSVLTITLGNSNGGSISLTGAFTDTLPANVVVAALPNIGGTCTTASVTASGSSVSYASGAMIPSGGCTITVNVTSSVSGGPYTNTIPAGALTTSSGSNGAPATANLFVNPPQPPSLSKFFSPTTIGIGRISTLTLSLGNGNAADTTLTADLVDNLPANLLVAPTPNVRVGGGCTLANVVAVAGGTTITYKSGGAIPAGGCSVSIDVTSSIAATYTNTLAAGALHTGIGNNAVSTSAQLVVKVLPSVTKSFSPNNVLIGSDSTLTITLGNTKVTALTLTATLTDTLPIGLKIATTPSIGGTCTTANVTAVAGSTFLSYATGSTIPAGGCTITVKVTSTIVGTFTNTIPAGGLQTDDGNNPDAATATLTVYGSIVHAPTLPQWALILLFGLVGLIGLKQLREQGSRR